MANALAACGNTATSIHEVVSIREESLDIRLRLFQECPTNTRALRDYTVALDYMGDTLAQAENLPQALGHYSHALELTQAACLHAPHNITLMRDNTISLNKIGDMQARMGNNDAALQHYEEACALRRKLTATHPENNSLLKDYSYSLMRVATLQAQQGENSIPNYRMAMEIRKHLMQLQPGNATYIYNTANCLAQLGQACLHQHEAEQGHAFLAEAHTLMQQLVNGAPGPTPAAWQALLQETALP
ncbi:tetratricopeptide repeat protein [Desulfovibrio cuneatus]|uniref:tetratricopeptide repeat protein n=1 Tax=Desulfovibrio cuneatus TaxID=159728 RepID=UPI00041C89B2|nr:tetratricopeptide repeat protein [Desulfovibrio cuneatus]